VKRTSKKLTLKCNKRWWTRDKVSDIWIASFHSLLSISNFLVIIQFFNILFMDFSHVKFCLYLSMFSHYQFDLLPSGSLLNMSKSSQMILHKFLFDCLQGPLHDISSQFVIGLLQVNEDYMHIFLLFHVPLYKLSSQKNGIHSQSLGDKTKLVFSDIGQSP
jgi:hypothetical protein